MSHIWFWRIKSKYRSCLKFKLSPRFLFCWWFKAFFWFSLTKWAFIDAMSSDSYMTTWKRSKDDHGEYEPIRKSTVHDVSHFQYFSYILNVMSFIYFLQLNITFLEYLNYRNSTLAKLRYSAWFLIIYILYIFKFLLYTNKIHYMHEVWLFFKLWITMMKW